MGGSSSKPTPSHFSRDSAGHNLRFQERQSRGKKQEKLRPTEPEPQAKYAKKFDKTTPHWPVFQSWNTEGQHMQGLTLHVIEPKSLRGQKFTILVKDEVKYSIRIGFGSETKFDESRLVMQFNLPDISPKQAKIHFLRMRDRSSIQIEDEVSLHGTFILRKVSPKGPTLEREVTSMSNLADVHFIRFAESLVVALENTQVLWPVDECDVPLTSRTPTTDAEIIKTLLEDSWYFPQPRKK